MPTTFGDKVVYQFIEKIDDLSSNFVFAAVPLFVFMGAMLEKSGIADRLFEAESIEGAMSGVTLASGLRSANVPESRASQQTLWRSVAARPHR